MKLNIQRFAVTTSTTFNEPALTDAMITGNYSTLKITIYLSPNNNVTWFSSKRLWCNCNGVAQYQDVGLSKGGSINATFTFNNIPHNADGTKTINWSWDISTGTSVIGDWEESGTKVLQTIPRASQPTFSSSSVDLGNSVTITTNRVSENFTHTLTYSIGNTSGTIATNVTDTATWTPAITLANEIPDSTNGTAIITCQTYNGTTLIGTTTANLTLNVPTSVVPSVSIGTLTEANTTMQDLNWGVFVQNKSQLNIPITASGIYGSTINSIVTTINGIKFNGSNVVTSTLVTAGTNTISTTVTDSRGRTATTTKTYNVVAYSNPVISTAQVQRCLQDGTISDEGTYLLYTFIGSISPVSNNNSSTFRIGRKLATDSNYTYETISSTYSVNVQNAVSSYIISADYIYDVVFEAIDSFMTTALNRTIDTGFDLMNFNASGKSMAIGKVSQASASEELLEVGINSTFEKNVDIDGIFTLKGYEALFHASDENFTILSANNEFIYFRPSGIWNGTGQAYIAPNGTIYTSGDIYASGGKRLAYHSELPSVMTLAGMSVDVNASAGTMTTLSLVNGTISTNARLSASGGGIRIGTGITKVKASCSVYFTTKSGADIANVYIYNNNVMIARGLLNSNTNYNTVTIPPIIINVSEGDIIKVLVRSQGGSCYVSKDATTTYLTVEEVI